MKILTVCFPTLMVAGLTLLLAMGVSTRETAGNVPARAAERSQLEQERKAVTERLKELGPDIHHMVPRGGL